MPAQLVARDLTFTHGPSPVLAGVDLTVAPGQRIGVVGPNGVGKTTLLRLLAGTVAPESGIVERVPGDASVGHLTQELDTETGETVIDVIRRRSGIAAAQRSFDRATDAVVRGDPGADDAYAAALHHWTAVGAADADRLVDRAIDRVGLPERSLGQPADTLSGGERARVNLASVLLTSFDVLLLDEPTNDLDHAGLDLLESFLLGADTGVVVVSHDRAFLEQVVTDVLAIDEHARTGALYRGGWTPYQEQQAVARRHAEEAHAGYVRERASLAQRAQTQREWADQGRSRAVRRPSDGDKFVRNHRIAQTEKLAGKARRTETAMERLEVVDKPWEGWDLRLEFAATGRSGDRVVEYRDVVVDRDGFRLGPVDLDVTYGERVALVGPNGSGKTTLLAVGLGRIAPDHGTVRRGPSVVVGELDQARRRFGGHVSLLDAFVAETGVSAQEARSELAKLGVDASGVARNIDRLSPGERTRAVLAAFALVGVNLLVLDEPTNHLDLPAIDQLEAALADYEGTLILVSHDRRLLEQVTTDRTIGLEDGRIVSDT